MSIDDKESGQRPEPNEKDLIDALKNKDDIPILMDVILEDLKVKVSQEDYLFNSISEPIPVLSDVSDIDVENAFSEKVRPIPQPENDSLAESVNEERVVVPENVPDHKVEVIPRVDEARSDRMRGFDAEVRSENAVNVQDVSEGFEQGIGHNTQTEISDSYEADESFLNTVLPEEDYDYDELAEAVPSVIILPNEKSESPELGLPLVKTDESPKLKNITMVNTTTFNQDDLKSAIERAFVTLLPELMDQVLKELNTPAKKE